MTPCRALQDHLHRDAATLGDAERLQLEYHLQSCAECASTRRLLVRAREVHAAMPRPSIGPRGHASAIAAALLEGVPNPVLAPRSRSRVVLGGLAFAIAVAASVIVVVMARSNEPVRVAKPDTEPDTEPAPAVEPPVVATPTLQEDGPVQLARSAVVRLTATSITAVADADMTIAEDGHAVRLNSGRIVVEVDPKAHHDLRVITPRFVVEVTGTVFEIDANAVTVSRGSVRVKSPDGTVLVERLAAGATWAVPPPAKTRQTVRRPDNPQARVRAAEAAMRGAETAVLANDLETAILKYRAISDRYRDLPAGETALFTAARLGLRRDASDGAALLDEYLRRYPNGRYAEHARKLATPR